MGNHKKGIARVAATATLALGLSSVALPAHAASIFDDPNYQAMVNALSMTEQAIMASQTVSLAITQSAGASPDALAFASNEDVVLTPTVSTIQLTSQYSQDDGATWMPQGSNVDETISGGVAYRRFDPMESVCLDSTICLSGKLIQKLQKSSSTWISARVTDLPAMGSPYAGMINPTPALGLGLLGLNASLGQIPDGARVTVDDSDQLLTKYTVESTDGSVVATETLEKATGWVLDVDMRQTAQSEYAEVSLELRSLDPELAAPNFVVPVHPIDAGKLLRSAYDLLQANTKSILKFASSAIAIANAKAKKVKRQPSLADAYAAVKKLATKNERITKLKTGVIIRRSAGLPSCASITVSVKTKKLQRSSC